MAQTKAGQNLRWYFQGSPVGMGRMSSLKPDTARGLDPVKQAGDDDIVEYVPKVKETTVAFGYNVISKRQLYDAMSAGALGYGGAGQGPAGLAGGAVDLFNQGEPAPVGSTPGAPGSGGGPGAIVAAGVGGGTGGGGSYTAGPLSVPEIPDNFDCVERRIKAGTANVGHYASTGAWISDEIVQGYTLYQRVQWEKDSYDQEVDKIVARSLSAKCKRPLDFEGINGIQFDTFMGNGQAQAWKLSQKTIVPVYTGQRAIRAESPLQVFLVEGVDFTISLSGDGGGAIVPINASGAQGLNSPNIQQSSTTATINFAVPPASSTVANILVVYAY